jgi:ATPase subunit of ABC transporter with duplicated ATPase domains
MVISHDRAFLTQAATRIFELRRGALTVYEGNYHFYLEHREIRERQAWQRFHAHERRTAAALQAAERRDALANRVSRAPRGTRTSRDFYRRKAGKVARTARLLRERAVRCERADKPWEDDPIPLLVFPNVRRSSGIVLRVEGLSKAYGGNCLFRNLCLEVRAGTRWAILGPNGCGKSTLLRILTGYERPDEGTVRFGARVSPGYFPQACEDLDADKSPLDLCRDIDPNETHVRTILGCLRLRGEDVLRPIHSMSAGQRVKVSLTRLLLKGPNLLLLDELTNHLDIEAREAVEDTLGRFPGTLLFVSHDRYFVQNLAQEILDLPSHR